MTMIRAGAMVDGGGLDEEALFARAKGEAEATLTAKDIDLCNSAIELARPGGLLVRN